MLEKVARVGREAALAAGALLRRNYLKPHHVTLKGAIDPVTESDLQAQQIIMDLIRQHFPDHAFLAEERVGEGGEDLEEGTKDSRSLPLQKTPPPPHPQSLKAGLSGPTSQDPLTGVGRGAWGEGRGPLRKSPWPSPRWIIDPLDGTVNFAHGFPMFCVSIAFEAEGRLEYGVVYDPLRDELFEARRGEGAILNGQPIRVSAIDRLDRALLATGFPYDIRERLPETLARLGRMLGFTQGVRRAGSAALDMAYVACGRLDGFWEENLKPWDTAAGLLLITEAGGRITTFSGGPYDIDSPNIVASNGTLHSQILSCLSGQA
jgi:myo-inositol-1(or 4)-monophosphatase